MTNWIIAVVVVAALVVGGGLYLISAPNPAGDGGAAGTMLEGSEMPDNGMVGGDAAVGDKSTPKLLEKSKFSGSWTDLVKLGGAYSCTIASTAMTGAGEADTSGTVYVAGTDLRGDFTSTVNGKVEETHMIRVGDLSYVWSSSLPQGMVMTITGDGAKSGDTVGTSGMGVDDNASYEWDCNPWSKDESKFAPPSNIEFMDLSSMMQGAGIPGN